MGWGKHRLKRYRKNGNVDVYFSDVKHFFKIGKQKGVKLHGHAVLNPLGRIIYFRDTNGIVYVNDMQ